LLLILGFAPSSASNPRPKPVFFVAIFKKSQPSENNIQPIINANKNINVPVNENINTAINQNVNATVDNGETIDSGEIDTSDWLTYRNEEYGFEMKYPNNFNLIDNYETTNDKLIYFQSNINPYAPLHLDVTSEMKIIFKDKMNQDNYFLKELSSNTVQNIQMNGLSFEYYSAQTNGFEVYIPLDVNIAIVFLSDFDKNISNNVLSTFKLIKKDKIDNEEFGANELDISNWLIYDDKELGINFRYPEKWGEVIKDIIYEGLTSNDGGTYEYTRIYFSNISYHELAITLVAPNFISDKMPDIWSGFTGEKENFICPDPSLVNLSQKEKLEYYASLESPDPNLVDWPVLDCNQITSPLQMVSYYGIHIYPNSDQLRTVKHFKIWNKNSKYQGITIDSVISSLTSPYFNFADTNFNVQEEIDKYYTLIPQVLNNKDSNKQATLEIQKLDAFVSSFLIKN